MIMDFLILVPLGRRDYWRECDAEFENNRSDTVEIVLRTGAYNCTPRRRHPNDNNDTRRGFYGKKSFDKINEDQRKK